ncbi:HAD family hydrolase [Blastomonas sp.]|uniref:HAD family hydrolase n=1 Tax=Blastomonas sp. TaxID=1909299 RepID=UPI0035945EF6
MTNPVENVIFDVGMVLYRWDLRLIFAPLLGDRAKLDWFVANIVTPEWHGQHDAGRSPDDMVAERVAEFPQYDMLIRRYATHFIDSLPGPVPGMIDLVEALAARGVPLFGITNFGAEFWDQFRPTAPVFDLFEDIVVSGVEKLVKPDPAIYRLAIARFGIDPARSLFIDDRPENIDAAIACGLQGHVFRDAPTLQAELAARGVLDFVTT